MVSVPLPTLFKSFWTNRTLELEILLFISSLSINEIASFSLSANVASVKLIQFHCWTSRDVPASRLCLIWITKSSVNWEVILERKSAITAWNCAWPFSVDQIFIAVWTSIGTCNNICQGLEFPVVFEVSYVFIISI